MAIIMNMQMFLPAPFEIVTQTGLYRCAQASLHCLRTKSRLSLVYFSVRQHTIEWRKKPKWLVANFF